MTQLFTLLTSSKSIKNSFPDINNALEALASQFGGTAFPTANLYDGMPCWRSDQGKLYVLKDKTVPTWQMVFDGRNYTEGWDKVQDLSSGIDLNTIVTSGWYHQSTNAGASAGANYPAGVAGMLQVFATATMIYQFYTSYNTGTPAYYWRTKYSTTWGAWVRVLSTADEGAGKGLDADTVDGYQTATAATANTIPVRDAAGKLPGDITGNAATATTAGSADAVTWAGVSGKPNTMSGYGITDFTWAGLAGKPTTLSGFGITDALNLAGGTMTGGLIISNAAPSITFQETDQTLPAGSRRFILNGNVMYLNRNTAAAGDYSTSANDLTISATGDLTALGNVAAYSDARLKRDLKRVDDALGKVAFLTGYTYTRIDSGERHTGLIAQDVQKVLPEAVSESPDGTLSVAYGNMVGLLVEAIKELSCRVIELEKKAA